MLRGLAANYHLSSWSILRRLGRSPAFASVVFYPLIAGLISLNQRVVEIPVFGQHLTFSPSLAIRLYILYFSLLFLFLGSVIYALRCPEMFKRYENSLEYGKSETAILTYPAFCKENCDFVQRRLDKHSATLSRIAPSLTFILKNTLLSVQDEIERGADRINDATISLMLLAHWEFMNKTFPYARVCVFVFYWLGLTLIALVAAVSVLEIVYNLTFPSERGLQFSRGEAC